MKGSIGFLKPSLANEGIVATQLKKAAQVNEIAPIEKRILTNSPSPAFAGEG
jgi:hypothetical protein